MITKEKFMAGVRKTWSKIGHCKGAYYETIEGYQVFSKSQSKNAVACCGIAAYSIANDLEPNDVLGALHQVRPALGGDLMVASDYAESKEQAISRMDAVSWS